MLPTRAPPEFADRSTFWNSIEQIEKSGNAQLACEEDSIMPKKKNNGGQDNQRYHDTWRLLKKYRDVVWILELSVQQVKSEFHIEYGTDIEGFLDSIYLAGADLNGTQIENHAWSIERSHKSSLWRETQ